jgi:hypothetical protein
VLHGAKRLPATIFSACQIKQLAIVNVRNSEPPLPNSPGTVAIPAGDEGTPAHLILSPTIPAVYRERRGYAWRSRWPIDRCAPRVHFNR